MKTSIKIFIAALLLATMVTAQNTEIIEKIHKDKYAVPNLIECIKSDNPGVKKYGIYFAGKYRVSETLPQLVNVLSGEDEEQIKKLAALSIYKIGDPKGLAQLEKAFSKCEERGTKKLFKAVLETYQIEKDLNPVVQK